MYKEGSNTTFEPFKNMKFINPVMGAPTFGWSNYAVLGLLLGLFTLGIAASIVSFVSTS